MGPERAAGIAGLDHVSLPLQHTDAMVAFYRALGLEVAETEHLVSVHAGRQMINFHRPEVWQRAGFTLRAPAATPPCGDLCFVWEGTPESMRDALDRAGARIEEGPVAREGAQRAAATSVYVRDPDGNLVELLAYATAQGEEHAHAG